MDPLLHWVLLLFKINYRGNVNKQSTRLQCSIWPSRRYVSKGVPVVSNAPGTEVAILWNEFGGEEPTTHCH